MSASPRHMADVERGRDLNLEVMCYEGFYQCGHCKHIGAPGDQVADKLELEAPHWFCTECSRPCVHYHAPTLTR